MVSIARGKTNGPPRRFLNGAEDHYNRTLWTARGMGRDLWRDDAPEPDRADDGLHSSALWAREAIRLFRDARRTNSTAPVFLYLAFSAAHSPLQAEPAHLARCAHLHTRRRRAFCGLVVSLDDAVGEVRARCAHKMSLG